MKLNFCPTVYSVGLFSLSYYIKTCKLFLIYQFLTEKHLKEEILSVIIPWSVAAFAVRFTKRI